MKLPSAQSQQLRERVSDAKSIASAYPRLKRGPEVANLSGSLWEFEANSIHLREARLLRNQMPEPEPPRPLRESRERMR